MKYIVIVIMFLMTVATFTECKKAATAPKVVDTTVIPTIYMYGQINGRPFICDSATGSLITYFHDSGVYNLVVSGNVRSGGVNDEISFYITYFNGLGQYGINPPSVYATYYHNNIRHYASEGLITVSVDSSNFIRGAFSFAADSLNITNGTFSVGL